MGNAWNGFAELRKSVLSSGSPQESTTLPFGHGDSVHAMRRLDDLAAPDLDHDRLHGGGA